MGAWVDRRASAATLGDSPPAPKTDTLATDAWPAAAVGYVPQAGGTVTVHAIPFLKTLVFCGGFTSIGVELAASRLLAPYFGSSTFIWASLIGLTLTFLALGYYLGGRLADRRPDPHLLYVLAAVAALAIAAIPLVSRPLLSESL